MSEINASQIKDYVREWIKDPIDQENSLPYLGRSFIIRHMADLHKEISKTSKGRAKMHSCTFNHRHNNKNRASPEDLRVRILDCESEISKIPVTADKCKEVWKMLGEDANLFVDLELGNFVYWFNAKKLFETSDVDLWRA